MFNPQTLTDSYQRQTYQRNHLMISFGNTTQKNCNDKILKETAEVAYITRKMTSSAGKMCWFAI